MSPGLIFVTVVVLWVTAEFVILFVKRSHPATATRDDRNSGLVIMLSLAISPFLAGVASGALRSFRMPGPIRPYAFWGGLALIVIGFVIRLTAIFTLDRLFTVDVAIAKDHRVVDHGLYAIVRHPSYAGSLLSFLGLGFAFRNWASLAIVMIGAAIGIGYRIAVEEKVLTEALGDDYRAYAARTKRLIPGVF
ncbi:MAG TPA: isoprenylcysteine carboxylmethyltransferase family protein [Thermoanaerobaculia bacterium]